MSLLTRSLACALALCASAAIQAQTVLFDNGAPDHASGNNLGFAWQAEDFALAAPGMPGTVRFFSLELAGAYRGAISWQIVGDNSGLPGGVIHAQGTSGAVQRVATGTYLGLLEYENSFALASPPSLPAGTYWLVLHNGEFSDLGDPNEFLWETAGANGTHFGMETVDGGMNYTINFNEHAFALLSAVPEPAQAWMLLAGLLALGAWRWRAHRKVLSVLALLPGLAGATTPFELNALNANLGPPLSQLSRMTKPATARHRVIPYLRVTPQMRGQPDPLELQGRASAPYSELITWPASPPLPRVNTDGTPINIEGISENGGAPSDANGAAGATQYVQSVNVEFAVYRKSDGVLLLGPLPGNAFWAGMSGSPGADACRTNNNGDPIIKYDQLAQRWIATQPAWVGSSGPFFQCIAVSTSEDATGSYYRYVLPIVDSQGQPVFNDYPKMSVWPDAYYFTFVLFSDTSGGYQGPRACGLDRAAMLAGGSAGGLCADFGDAFGPMLASDLDGASAPPPQSPAFLMSLDFDANGAGDRLYFWRMSFSSNTLSGAIALPVAPFTIACPSSYGGPCIRQPTPGETLDALGDRLMYRLAYRNFGNREALVVNHSVQQPGVAQDGPAGVRWYEVRNPGGAVQVYQQGTFAPDSDSRWMGSAAMDKMGNLAVAYSVSGAGTQPGIRYSGRLRTEPLGRLEQEATIINGAGVQIDTFHRWGDYSALAADPADDCTFWYTNQYIGASGSFNWRSRIASFTFRNCR